MDRDHANATRLRVNRIALIQQLDTQELIPKLINARIITPDQDVQFINKGTSRIDRARRLIDCFLKKDNEYVNRPPNWYLLFRNILLENPSIYRGLVTALDNTIIKTQESTLSKSQITTDRSNTNRDLPDKTEDNNEQKKKTTANSIDETQITSIEFDRFVMNKAFVEGSFQRVVDNLPCYSQVPQHLFDQLQRSPNSYDHEQLAYEQEAYDNMRRLELFVNLMKQEKSLSHQNIFDIPTIDIILNDPLHQHLYFKYFFALSFIYGVHYDRQLVETLKTVLNQTNDILVVVEKGFGLYYFLYNYGKYELCQQIIESIVQALTKSVKQHHQKSLIWSYLFRGCCALVQAHNQTFQIQDAWSRIEAAHEIADSLKATGIAEITNDNHAYFYSTISQTAYEDANFDGCIQYGYKGLKLVNKNNHSLIIDLLGSLSQGLTAKYIMNKAQATAVMAVQYAAKYCGRNSPKYIHALQQLVQYSNEFIQDQTSVELAQHTLDRAQIVYGYESLTVAHCHRALSKSLITFTSGTKSRRNIKDPLFEDNSNYSTTPIRQLSSASYLHHANEAFRIAQEWFGVDDRVRLFPFKMSLAHALQAQIAVNSSDMENTYFEDVMQLLNDCFSIAQDIFGSMSFKVAQVHRLRSAAFLSKKMYNEAEQELQICMQIYKLCLPPNSFHYLVAKASLGLLYKQQQNYEQAVALFQNIAESLDTKTQAFRWINMVLESLLECYTHLEAKQQESPRLKSAADKVRSELYEWRRTNAKRTNIINLIHQEPTCTIEQFVHDLTKFQHTTDRIHALLRAQQKSKLRIIPTKTQHDT